MYNKRPLQKKKGGKVAGGPSNLQITAQGLTIGTSRAVQASTTTSALAAQLPPVMTQGQGQVQAQHAKMLQGQAQGLVARKPQNWVPINKPRVSASSSSTMPPSVVVSAVMTQGQGQVLAQRAKMPLGQKQGPVARKPQNWVPTSKPPVSASSSSIMPPSVVSAVMAQRQGQVQTQQANVPHGQQAQGLMMLHGQTQGLVVSASSSSTAPSVVSASSSAAPAPGVQQLWPQLKVGKYNAPGSDPCEEAVHYNRNCRVHGREHGLLQNQVEHVFGVMITSFQKALHSVGKLSDLSTHTLLPK